MKIITWNINGIRAALDKGIWDWIKTQNPDVVCLQEIKAREEQLSMEQCNILNGYYASWNPASRPGYSGVATFSATQPRDVVNGMGNPNFDIEGRVIRTRFPNFVLYNIYFPSGQSGGERVAYKLDFYAQLLKVCDQMHDQKEKIVLCGDFNTAFQEIDLRNPKENQHTSGFLPEEREMLGQYFEHGFVDVFRQQNPDQVKYSWWTYRFGARKRNIGWRIDYFLASKDLMPHISDIIIHDDVTGSDHCPISMTIN